jgi:hypothetical protein
MKTIQLSKTRLHIIKFEHSWQLEAQKSLKSQQAHESHLIKKLTCHTDTNPQKSYQIGRLAWSWARTVYGKMQFSFCMARKGCFLLKASLDNRQNQLPIMELLSRNENANVQDVIKSTVLVHFAVGHVFQR